MTYTLQNVLLGSIMLGVSGGVLGSFAFLRRQSLLGDALAHAALPGVCIAYILTGTKAPLPLLLGALAAGVTGSLFILFVVRWTKIKEDAAIGIVLSVFFGLGIVLLTRIQKMTGGNQSGLDKYLFGQAATLVEEDLKLMAILGAVALIIVAAGFKEFKLISFDPGFGQSLGYPVRRLEILLTCLLVIIVVVGLQTVGVVLMVATLITPAAAARQWTERLSIMVILAGAIGGLSGAVGAVASATAERLPTGPMIVLVSSAVLVVSLLFAPERGLLWARLRDHKVRDRIRRENLLKDMFLMAERSGETGAFVSSPSLMGLRGRGHRDMIENVRPLVRDGLIERGTDEFRLTESGLAEAERVVRNHRLWEVYLSSNLALPLDHRAQ
ncbi:MAG: iron chelate uptake ABC transporter family permease subunit [Candidatus Hydrogenedentota bacterium]